MRPMLSCSPGRPWRALGMHPRRCGHCCSNGSPGPQHGRGDTDGARRVLGAVDDAYASRSPGIEEPEWVYWLDRNEIDVMAGRCLIELGDPLAAEPLLTAAINAYAPEPAREVTLYRTWLAESYARAGILDAAAAMIARARKAARGLGSVRLDVRVAAVESLLSRQVT